MIRLVTLAALALSPGSALAMDCAKARVPLEIAICADPTVKASDDAMAAAFEQVRASAQPDQRRAILDDQRAWLKSRGDACGGDKPAACATESNRKRVAALLAEPGSGPGLDPRPVPVFVRQAGSRSKVEVGVRLYRFAAPQSAGERTLNAEADKTLAAIEYKKAEPDERDWSRDVDWTIAYASPAFVSMQTASYEYSGGAHGYGSVGALNIDMKTGRVLAIGDLFDGKAQTEIGKLCLAQVRTEKKERGADDGGEFEKDLQKNVAEGVRNLGAWVFRQDKATVTFNQYEVGSYAEGPYVCDLTTKQLGTLSKVPLPPR